MKNWIVLALMVTAVLVLYGRALNNWWWYDDTQILKHAIHFSPHEYFFIPEAWRALIPYSLTPWLTLSYDIDHALFGFSPMGFYAHNLLAIALCVWLIYLIARQWVDGRFALGGALLFLVGSPIAVASQQLMVRHYTEGLLFYLLAVLLFIMGMREKRTRLGWLAGLAFAIAASAKEIYLPLGFVCFLLPVGSFRQRLAIAWPFLLVMLLYVPWRWYMLGEVVGGYVPAETLLKGDFIHALTQVMQIPSLLLATPGAWLVGGIAVAGLVLAWRGRKSPGTLLLWFILPILLLVPLIPLALNSSLDSERFFVAVWAAVALGTSVVLGNAVGGHRLRWLPLLVLAALVMTAWIKSRQALTDMMPIQAEYFAQGAMIASAGSSDILYITSGLIAHYPLGLLDLRPAMGRTDAPPLLVADEVELAGISLAGRRVLRYDPVARAMLDITPQIPKMLAQWCERLRPLPLSVEMTYDGKAKSLRWQLGPHTAGGYVYLNNEGSLPSRIPVPPQYAMRMEKRLENHFLFRYDALEGWVAYTPPLSLPPADGHGVSRLSWHGNGSEFSGADGTACRIKARQ